VTSSTRGVTKRSDATAKHEVYRRKQLLESSLTHNTLSRRVPLCFSSDYIRIPPRLTITVRL
jgi:hypothetical protein